MRAAVLVSILLACALAGCGGDDDDGGGLTPTTPAPAPRDEYVAALDAVCKDAAELEQEWDADQKRIDGRRDLIRHFRRRSEGGRQLLVRYEQIRPPAKHRAFHRRYLETIRDQITYTERALNALEADDDAAYRRLTRKLGSTLVRRSDLFARNPADFEHCGQP